MSYFELFTCSTVTSTAGLDIFKDSILALSHQRNYLMHAMLGMAAAHLLEVDVIAQDQQQSMRFRKTEFYHWHHAIHLYRTELTKEVALDHIDSLITTCMLLGIHSFYMSNPTETSFVHAPKSQRQAKLQWVVIPLGFRLVLRHIQHFITASVWFDLFCKATPAEDGWTIKLESAFGIYADFLDLCEITPRNHHLPSIYKDALKDLFAMLQVEELSIRDLAQLMAFMGRLGGSFQRLLVARDSKALLIMLYWLVLLNSLDLWWVRARAACEIRAILGYLESDSDTRIQRMLVVPRITSALFQ